ncbi:MAG: glycosyltransferase family 2 protein [Hyphomicrobium sp.]
MRCPTLAELPAPPSGKTGWPWTDEAEQLGPSRPDRSPWPKISIVTPSYNQGQFIEETVRSILLQGYPDLEYIIMDGGSTDGSVDIIRKYAAWLKHWESAKDKGQADAINRGLRHSTGDVFQYINSDDLAARGAFQLVGEKIGQFDAVAGAVAQFKSLASEPYYVPVCGRLTPSRMIDSATHTKYSTFHQPGLWLKRAHVQELGGLNANYRYCFDHLLAVRYLERWDHVHYTSKVLACARTHDGAKSVAEIGQFFDEIVGLRAELSEVLLSSRLRRLSRLAIRKFHWRREFGALLDDKSLRTPYRIAQLMGRAIMDPRIAFDYHGRKLHRTAVARIVNLVGRSPKALQKAAPRN